MMISFDVLYNRLDAASILPFAEAIELTDVSSGKPSTLKITLCNADLRFVDSWAATKGDGLTLKLGGSGAVTFSISKISVQASPRLVTWEAVSVPAVKKAPQGRGAGSPPPSSGAVVSEKRSWSGLTNVTLRDVATRVCDECGLALNYKAAKNPVLAHCVRTNETGVHLVKRYARMFGLDVRSSAGSLTIVGVTRKQDDVKPETVKIPFTSIVSVAKAESVTPACAVSGRLDPRSGDRVASESGDDDGAAQSFDFDLESPSDIFDAVSASSFASDLSIVPTAGVVAGCVLSIEGFGVFEVVEMKYSRSGGAESMNLKCRGA